MKTIPIYQSNHYYMGKYQFKRIGTFADFCKSKKTQTIKENNEVAINVPFWDEAIQNVMDDVRYAVGLPISWEKLIDFLKVKFAIIDRKIEGDENLVVAHLRDLLFQHYGETILGGDFGCLTYDTAEMGAKSLVISQLANEILRQIRIESGKDIEPVPETEPKPLATVSLGYEDPDDCLPFESKRVVEFETFSSMLKESLGNICTEQNDRCLDYTLNVLQSDFGSLDIDKILEAAEAQNTTLEGYISRIVEGYVVTEKIGITGKSPKELREQREVLHQARKAFANQTVRDVLSIIAKENKSKTKK